MTQAQTKTAAATEATALTPVPVPVPTKRQPTEFEILCAKPVDLDAINADEPVEYVSYDGRHLRYTLANLFALLGDAFEHAERSEIVAFIAYCMNNRMDPMRKQVYFIKYKAGESPAFVTSWYVYLDRAQRHCAFDGLTNGVVWRISGDKGQTWETRHGRPCDYDQDQAHVIVGGWAAVYRKDISRPFEVEVPIGEMIGVRYDKKTGSLVPTRTWAQKLTTMATKTPTARALRQAFPEDLGGLLAEGENLIADHVADPSPVADQAPDAPPARTRQERQDAAQTPPPGDTKGVPAANGGKKPPTPAQRVAAHVRTVFPGTPKKALAHVVTMLADLVTNGEHDPQWFADTDAWTDEIADRCIVTLGEMKEGEGLPPEWLGAEEPADA